MTSFNSVQMAKLSVSAECRKEEWILLASVVSVERRGSAAQVAKLMDESLGA